MPASTTTCMSAAAAIAYSISAVFPMPGSPRRTTVRRSAARGLEHFVEGRAFLGAPDQIPHLR